MANYPEHEKLKAIQHQSQMCKNFIDFLREKGIILCEEATEEQYEESRECRMFKREVGPAYLETSKRDDQIISEFFEIDLNALSREKDQMIEEIRAGRPA